MWPNFSFRFLIIPDNTNSNSDLFSNIIFEKDEILQNLNYSLSSAICTVCCYAATTVRVRGADKTKIERIEIHLCL